MLTTQGINRFSTEPFKDFVGNLKRFRRCERVFKWINRSKETTKNIFETSKGTSPGYSGKAFTTKTFRSSLQNIGRFRSEGFRAVFRGDIFLGF